MTLEETKVRLFGITARVRIKSLEILTFSTYPPYIKESPAR
jgi:hypothetical protein